MLLIVGPLLADLIRGPPSAVGPRRRRLGAAAATTGVVVAADQALKQAAIASVRPGRSENVFFGIDLTNTRNTRRGLRRVPRGRPAGGGR